MSYSKRCADVHSHSRARTHTHTEFLFAQLMCMHFPSCGKKDTRGKLLNLHFHLFSDGDNGRGSAKVTTKQVFDRERRKYYYIPIVMWDMRGKNSSEAMTGTNTLTVTIADINDNELKPGHQDVFVYNYKGIDKVKFTVGAM